MSLYNALKRRCKSVSFGPGYDASQPMIDLVDGHIAYVHTLGLYVRIGKTKVPKTGAPGIWADIGVLYANGKVTIYGERILDQFTMQSELVTKLLGMIGIDIHWKPINNDSINPILNQSCRMLPPTSLLIPYVTVHGIELPIVRNRIFMPAGVFTPVDPAIIAMREAFNTEFGDGRNIDTTRPDPDAEFVEPAQQQEASQVIRLSPAIPSAAEWNAAHDTLQG